MVSMKGCLSRTYVQHKFHFMQFGCASPFSWWSFSLCIEFDIWIKFDIRSEGKAEEFPDERRIWMKSFCSKGRQWLQTLSRAAFKVDADGPNFPVHWSLFEKRSSYKPAVVFLKMVSQLQMVFEQIFSRCPFVLLSSQKHAWLKMTLRVCGNVIQTFDVSLSCLLWHEKDGGSRLTSDDLMTLLQDTR